jgi:hypothetical protein
LPAVGLGVERVDHPRRSGEIVGQVRKEDSRAAGRNSACWLVKLARRTVEAVLARELCSSSSLAGLATKRHQPSGVSARAVVAAQDRDHIVGAAESGRSSVSRLRGRGRLEQRGEPTGESWSASTRATSSSACASSARPRRRSAALRTASHSALRRASRLAS